MSDKHPNSKQVTIFRAGSYLARAQGKDVQDYYADAKVSIGSFWESGSSNKVATGLTFSEQDLLMPRLVDCEKDDRDFKKKVTDFFIEIDIKIPNEGRILEIGLEQNNDQPVSVKNWPLSLPDYVYYRFAITHPNMAPNKETADSNPMYSYYLLDKDLVVQKTLNKNKEIDDARKAFYAIEDSPVKIREVLLLMGKDPREFSGKEADGLRKDFLRDLAEKKPALFLTTMKDTDISIRYWITAMIKSGVLVQIAQRIRVPNEDKTMIGNNMDEAIAFFLDEETNGDMIAALKAQQQEEERKAPKVVQRMTKKLNEV